jgi:hypothetical protein
LQAAFGTQYLVHSGDANLADNAAIRAFVRDRSPALKHRFGTPVFEKSRRAD